MTEEEAKGKAVLWISSIVGITTIQAYQSAERPDQPYVMVNLTGVREVRDQPIEINYLPTSNLTPVGEQEIQALPVIETEWQFSLHAYGEGQSSALRKIRSAMKVGEVRDKLFPLSPFEIGKTINTIPDWINERWENRSQVNLFIRGYVRDGLIVETIEEVSTPEITRV